LAQNTSSFRLSPQQEQLWRGSGDPALLVQCVVTGLGEPEAVHEALQAVVARHEALRTTFSFPPGVTVPVQVIHDALEPGWRLADEPPADVAAVEAAAGIDLEHGPVLRAAWTGDGRLVLTAAAACADARSLAVVAAELRDTGADEPLQYADYAAWRNELLQPGAPGLELADVADVPHSPRLPFTAAGSSGGARRAPVDLDAAALAAGADACRVPVAWFLEACWHACVARLAAVDDIVVGTVLDGRAQAELTEAVGPYAQTLPLRTTIDETTTVAELVDRVRRSRRACEDVQDRVDAALLAEIAQRCTVGFSLAEAGEDVQALLSAPTAFVVQLLWDGVGAAVLTPAEVDERAGRLAASALAAIVSAAGADTSAVVLDLPLGAGGTDPSVLAGPDSRAAGSTVARLFEARADAAPDAPALVAGDETLTYGDLNARANRLAHRLRALGVGRDTGVGLCFERSAASIVGLLAVLKAGGAYVPLNYEHPGQRLVQQLTEAGAPVLLAETSVRDRVPAFAGETVYVDDPASDLADEPDVDPDPVNEADDLAYVMYTSGSTGVPKGVGVTHANLDNYVSAILARLGDQDGPRSFAAVTALSTDLGNTSIFPSLLSGGTLHLVPPPVAMDGARFAAYLVKITPSHLRALLGAAPVAAMLPQHALVLGGEALAWDLVDRLRAGGATCRILNHYGPTETTIGTTTCDVDEAERSSETVPVGTPLAGTRAYVLDRKLRPLPVGVPGELCIGGAGVARGYVGQPEQTEIAFVADPQGAPGARMYRTGDRARVLSDGRIEFLGRLDDQVKIRGYRVEPAEIEAVLERHPAVRDTAVVAREGADGELELVAYVVGTDWSPDVLQAHLRDLVPPYMVPARFVALDALPFTPSGKIDRRALPAPGESERAAFVAPRTPLEESLAKIWEDLLGVDRVGVDDDFFALGGHSLLATQAIIRIRSTYGDVPLHALFNAPTVAGLADAIVQAELEREAAPVASGGAPG
jgi:amino acid adenylation domain-containing protein